MNYKTEGILGLVLIVMLILWIGNKYEHDAMVDGGKKIEEKIEEQLVEKEQCSFSIIDSMDGYVAIESKDSNCVTLEKLSDRHTIKCVITPQDEYTIFCTIGNSEYFCGYIFTDKNDVVIERYYDPNISQLKHTELKVMAPIDAKYLYINTQGAVIPTINVGKNMKLEDVTESNISDDTDSEKYNADEVESSNSILYGKKIAILGDSISSTDYELPVWWQIIEENSDCQFLNYAISSTSISHVDKRHLIAENGELDPSQIKYIPNDSSTWNSGNCFCERYTKIDKNVDCIVIFGGANDIGQPRGAWDSKETNTFYGGLNELFSGIKRNYAGVPVLVCSLIPRYNERDCDFKNPEDYLNNIRDVDPMSSQLRSVAIELKSEQYNLYYIDLYNNYGITIDNDILRDGLHPNKKGQELLAKSIECKLIEIFTDSSRSIKVK